MAAPRPHARTQPLHHGDCFSLKTHQRCAPRFEGQNSAQIGYDTFGFGVIPFCKRRVFYSADRRLEGKTINTKAVTAGAGTVGGFDFLLCFFLCSFGD